MPSVIAIEAKPVELEGLDSGFLHLYLVKTVTDEQGRVVSEKVIRGTAGSNGDLETLADANLATSPDRRGSDTLEERHHKVLDLGSRDADDVWQVMVQHANNIEKADLDYSVDIFGEISGSDLNSNSVVASVLHSVGLNLTTSFPDGVSRSDAPLYGQLQYMDVNDRISGTEGTDRIYGGVGNDVISGGSETDILAGEGGNDQLWGNLGNDYLYGGTGDDRLYDGLGNDQMSGGSGKDAFIFRTDPVGAASIDTVRDFSVADDTLWLDNGVFTELGSTGNLASGALRIGMKAYDSSDRVIFDRGDGILYFDADGSGQEEQVAVAKLTVGLKLGYSDFLVI
jgi:Ca2+-binding RTX toxin-like protein